MKKNLKEADEYSETFYKYVDHADKAGEKIGKWVVHGGWKIMAVTLVSVSILVFGFVQFIKGFGRNFKRT